MEVDTRLYEDVGALKATAATQGAQLTAMDAKLDRVISHIEREKGGKRALIAAGSVAGAIVGGIASAFVSWWTK